MSDLAPVTSERSFSWQRVAYWASLPLIALCIVVFVRFVLFVPYRIPTDSMEPTIAVGDRVIVNQLSYLGGEIERGQIVVFERPPNLPGDADVIKRVIGLPGETVRFIDGEIYIGDQRLVEPYVAAASTEPRGLIPGCVEPVLVRQCIVPPDQVLVLGDNRSNSLDGRAYGPIPVDLVIGRAVLRVWPAADVSQL